MEPSGKGHTRKRSVERKIWRHDKRVKNAEYAYKQQILRHGEDEARALRLTHTLNMLDAIVASSAAAKPSFSGASTSTSSGASTATSSGTSTATSSGSSTRASSGTSTATSSGSSTATSSLPRPYNIFGPKDPEI